MYTLIKEKPYFYKEGNIFPCEITAEHIKVDFKDGVKCKEKNISLYTESEIKQRLDIKLIDSWDAQKKKVIKKSNQSVSSIEAKQKK